MKALHIVYTYDPDPIGGTEIYVKQLCEQLARLGVENAIAAPGAEETIDGGTTKIFRYSFDKHPSYAVLYGGEDRVALYGFEKVLKAFEPDLVHFHSVSPANSYLLMELCKTQNLPVVLTLHTPAMICQRGDLLYQGVEICDNFLDADRCAQCYLQKLTGSSFLASGISALSHVLEPLAPYKIKGRMNLALHMRVLMQQRVERSRKIFNAVDNVVCPAKWVMGLLLKNQIHASKLIFSRQGIAFSCDATMRKKEETIKLIFLGRLDPLKGVHILLQALQKNTKLNLQLDIYAVIQSNDTYLKNIKQLVAQDSRVRIMKPVDSNQVVDLIAKYDALLVPSQCFETGPLVVLEAFAARTLSIGSELGSIAELIQDGVNGFLVKDYRSPGAWVEAIRKICDKPEMADEVRARIKDPKDMRSVADEMLELYRGLLTRGK